MEPISSLDTQRSLLKVLAEGLVKKVKIERKRNEFYFSTVAGNKHRQSTVHC